MKHFILILSSLFLILGLSHADNLSVTTSDANITGHVLEAGTQDHLGYVTIQVKGTQIGTTTAATGHFLFTNQTP